MKKVIFSAIAMVAFVGTSMANTSENLNLKLLVAEKTCEEKAMDYADAMSGSDVEVYWPYTAYLDACNASKKPKTNVLTASVANN